MTYFFTADEHYGHTNILKHAERPFATIEEHDEELIRRHNEVVEKDDIIIHAGDFCWCKTQKDAYAKYVRRLRGNHIFLKGSHDHWLPSSAKFIWRKHVNDQFIVVCHYAMRTWERSHYGAWHLYGHSHGRLSPYYKSFDVGIDPWNYYPVSFDMVKKKMETLESKYE
jgi:calcineurin-like phosphoesterase family protein